MACAQINLCWGTVHSAKAILMSGPMVDAQGETEGSVSQCTHGDGDGKWVITRCLSPLARGLGCSPSGPRRLRFRGAGPPRGHPGCSCPPFSTIYSPIWSHVTEALLKVSSLRRVVSDEASSHSSGFVCISPEEHLHLLLKPQSLEPGIFPCALEPIL